MIAWGIVMILAVLCIWLLGYRYRIRRQMKQICRDLENTLQPDNNSQIRIDLMDTQLNALVTQLNRNLDYQKELKYETDSAKAMLRQSISDIAHDMRTPLTVVKGNLQMLARTDPSDEQYGYIENCSRQTDMLRETVDAFFEMAVLECDDRRAVLTDVNVTNLMMQFIVEHEAVIRQHGLTPEIRLPEQTVFVRANETYLLRIFYNLLNNMIKYAENTFRITMQTASEETDGKCRICFENPVRPGVHMDPVHLFERTYQAESERASGGAGLGLYIVKLLAGKQDMPLRAWIEEDRLYIEMQMECACK